LREANTGFPQKQSFCGVKILSYITKGKFSLLIRVFKRAIALFII